MSKQEPGNRSRRNFIKLSGGAFAGTAAIAATDSALNSGQTQVEGNNNVAQAASQADVIAVQMPDSAQASQSQSVGRVSKKVALVTGPAVGIGRAVALMLAREGADIIAYDLCKDIATVPYKLGTPEDLAEVERMIRRMGRRCLAIRGDTRDMTQMRRAVERGIREFGKIDILVANAGILSRNNLAKMSDQELRDIIDVNLIGYFNSMRAVIPHMIERRQGRIVALSSTAGRFGIQNAAHYGASKWGIIGLVKSAALELGEFNVTVNAICPTRVNTRQIMNETVIRATVPDKPNPTVKDFANAALEQTVIKKPWLEPEEVAEQVLYFASNAARYITGEVVDVALGINARYTA